MFVSQRLVTLLRNLNSAVNAQSRAMQRVSEQNRQLLKQVEKQKELISHLRTQLNEKVERDPHKYNGFLL